MKLLKAAERGTTRRLWSATLWTFCQTLGFSMREKHWAETQTSVRSRCRSQTHAASHELPRASPQQSSSRHQRPDTSFLHQQTRFCGYCMTNRLQTWRFIFCSVVFVSWLQKDTELSGNVFSISEKIKEKNRWGTEEKTEALSREGLWRFIRAVVCLQVCLEH